MADEVAEHLVRTYGGQAWDVCELSQLTQGKGSRFGEPIVDDYPYIEAEIIYACREYACTVEDILSRRTRLAFLNKEAALEAVPRVANVMAKELGWTEEVTAKQVAAATQYVESYSGSLDNKAAVMREASYTDLRDVFNALDLDGNGFLDVQDVSEIATILGIKMSDKDIRAAFEQMDSKNNGRVSAEAFEGWWKTSQDSPFHKKLTKELGVVVNKNGDLKKLGMFS
jgi:glycerol-3-phosphate dehydrogenase